MPKLTKRIVESAVAKDVDYFIWDDELPGFGIRIFPSGRKRYVVQYRAGRRPRRINIAPTSALPCEQARNRAMGIIASVKAGGDPAAKRDADREAITVKELSERFDREHISVRVKSTTAAGYRRLLERDILPAIGKHRVIDVTRADISKLHHNLRHIPYEANRCLEVVSKMFSLAEVWGFCEFRFNPDGDSDLKPDRYSETKPDTDSDLKPAT